MTALQVFHYWRVKKTEKCFQLISSADSKQKPRGISEDCSKGGEQSGAGPHLTAEDFQKDAQLHLHQYDLHGRKPLLPPHHKTLHQSDQNYTDNPDAE